MAEGWGAIPGNAWYNIRWHTRSSSGWQAISVPGMRSAPASVPTIAPIATTAARITPAACTGVTFSTAAAGVTPTAAAAVLTFTLGKERIGGIAGLQVSRRLSPQSRGGGTVNQTAEESGPPGHSFHDGNFRKKCVK
jgi:hypothetical protein